MITQRLWGDVPAEDLDDRRQRAHHRPRSSRRRTGAALNGNVMRWHPGCRSAVAPRREEFGDIFAAFPAEIRKLVVERHLSPERLLTEVDKGANALNVLDESRAGGPRPGRANGHPQRHRRPPRADDAHRRRPTGEVQRDAPAVVLDGHPPHTSPASTARATGRLAREGSMPSRAPEEAPAAPAPPRATVRKHASPVTGLRCRPSWCSAAPRRGVGRRQLP